MGRYHAHHSARNQNQAAKMGKKNSFGKPAPTHRKKVPKHPPETNKVEKKPKPKIW
jgi:hypothetical protein